MFTTSSFLPSGPHSFGCGRKRERDEETSYRTLLFSYNWTINSDIRTHLLLKLFQFFVVIPYKIQKRKRAIAVITVINAVDTEIKLTSHFSL